MNHCVTVKRLFFILYLIIPTLLLSPPLATCSFAEEVVFVANSSVPDDTLSSTDINNIFLGKKTSWNNGSKITFVTLKDGEAHKYFLRTYLKRNPSQFKNHWKKMLFTGKGVIPRAFATDESVVDYISENEGHIGYISKKPENSGVKVITITE